MQKLIHSIFILATVGLLATACSSCSPQARKARHLEQANRYFDSGEYDKAEIEYMNVLKLEGLNPQAISRLGIIFFEQGRMSRVMPYLIKGRQLQPDNLPLRLKLGMFFLTIGNTKEAQDEANFILDRKPQDADALLLLVESVVRPQEVEAVRQRLKKLPTAESAPVLVALGVLELRQRHLPEAKAAFNRAQALDPQSRAACTGLGTLYWALNDPAQAEAAFKKAAALSPARSPERLQYAQFKIRTGDLESGKRLLEEMTRNTPDYLTAWFRLAEIAAREKKYDESAAFVAKALARDPVHFESMLLSGQLKRAKGENDKAVTEFERMQKFYPQAPLVPYQLGLAYLASGDTGKAISSLNQAVTLAPGFADAIVMLANLNIRKGDLSTAIVALKKLVQQRPDIVQARLLLADAYRGQGNLDEALQVYRQLEKQLPQNPQMLLLTGLVLNQRDQRGEAREAFAKALQRAPDYLPALEQLVLLDLLEKQYPAALQRVESQIAKDPKQPGPYLLLARVYLAQQDTNQAEAALRKAIEVQPDSPTAYFLLAKLYVSSNQQQKALANFQKVVANNPKDSTALLLIGMIHDQQKDYAAACDAYEKLLAANPGSGVALNNLAWLYSEHLDQLEKAYEMARRARELLPYDPHAADTLGWVLYRKRQYPAALSLFEESADKLPAEESIQFHLGMTHYMMGEEESARLALQRALQLNKEFTGMDEARRRLSILEIDLQRAGTEARAALEKAVAVQKDDPVALVRLAALYERDGAGDKAIGALETALQANPKNVRALMNLARLYAARQDTPKALELAKAARQLAPDDPGVAHTLGRLAYLTGDFKWAASLLQASVGKQPDEPETLYDFAEAAYSVGRISEAEEAMHRALQSEAPFTRGDEARRFLDMIALSADPAQAVAAASRIEQILKAKPAYVPALMAMGAISEQKPDARAAQQTYEKVLSQYPDFAPAKKRLVILHAENPGDNQKALDLAIKAREAFPDDPELAKAYGIIVYRQGDFARAAALLQESARKRSEDAELMYYLGMTQYRLNKRAESKQALQRALDLGLKNDLAAEARKTLPELK